GQALKDWHAVALEDIARLVLK
ncbi:MAG: hypothetical protein RLZZ164_897, partial [Actinomycetota bacterium]